MPTRAATARCFAVALVGTACGGPAGDEPAELAHSFPSISLEVAEEQVLCASWTLGNAEALHVDRVDMSAGPGWHHSNWFFFAESQYEGPDGIWPCEERGFETAAAAVGGGMLFAQSTQARSETQEFAAGAAVRIRPRAKIVGQVHLLNASGEPLDTGLSLRLRDVPEDSVDTLLMPLVFQYLPLAIPPLRESRFRASCSLEEGFGGPVDFNLHYVLPHYHELGAGARVTTIGGDRAGMTAFESASPIGEPAGQTMDPPMSLAGATGLQVSCDFDNHRDEVVGFGYGDQEMCIVFAFTDSELRWVATVNSGDEVVGDDGGREIHEAPCFTIALPSWQ